MFIYETYIMKFYYTMLVAIVYSYYQYGPTQGDINLRKDQGYTCDSSQKNCVSKFIPFTLKLQIFNGIYKGTQASYSFRN